MEKFQKWAKICDFGNHFDCLKFSDVGHHRMQKSLSLSNLAIETTPLVLKKTYGDLPNTNNSRCLSNPYKFLEQSYTQKRLSLTKSKSLLLSDTVNFDFETIFNKDFKPCTKV